MELPSLDELLACAHVVSIPTRTRFRGITEREAVIFDAPNGASEFSPFLEYDDTEASRWLAAAIEFGWGEIPEPRRTSIPVNATIPAVTPDEVPGVLARFPGCTTAKVKVAERGQTLVEDIARVRTVRELMGPDAFVRVDANGGWTVDEAYTALTALAEFDLEYAEQPCMTVSELVELRERLMVRGDRVAGSIPWHTTTDLEPTAVELNVRGSAPNLPINFQSNAYAAGLQSTPLVRIAADESIRKAEDPLEVARAGAADLIVVKAQPLGGVAPALGIIAEAGLPVIVSSALDTSVGISMGLHLAAALPDGMLTGACGLGTVALLDDDVAMDPLLPRNGELPVIRTKVNQEALRQRQAVAERSAWWRERIARCHALIAS